MSYRTTFFYQAFLVGLSLFLLATPLWAEAIDIGSRRELLVDDFLIDSTEGDIRLQLHHPVPREIVITYDAPWEGNACGYQAIFQDGDKYRMYYKAYHFLYEPGKLVKGHPLYACYAESEDGIHWKKPHLGLFEFQGSKKNNIVWAGTGAHDFTPFKDENPACKPDERYKAVARGGGGMIAFKSSDGIHWSQLGSGPIITDGAFDSQNLAFWDAVRGEYRAYYRDFRDGRRDIKTATSPDFVKWTSLGWLEYPGAPKEHAYYPKSPKEHLYINQIKPYYRAEHLFIGFPARYFERGWCKSMEALPDLENRRLRSSASNRVGMAISEGLLMTSRDGKTFRRWPEAFLRPGIQRPGTWNYGHQYIAWHAVETASPIEGAPPVLSIYANEGGKGDPMPSKMLRRHTMRLDGFVSLQAPLSGGQMVTKPLVFDGKELKLNFSTAAAGGIRVEIQDAQGKPLEGFRLDDSDFIFGDELARVVSWKNGSDVSALAGTPIRLRFELRDADLYAFQFQK